MSNSNLKPKTLRLLCTGLVTGALVTTSIVATLIGASQVNSTRNTMPQDFLRTDNARIVLPTTVTNSGLITTLDYLDSTNNAKNNPEIKVVDLNQFLKSGSKSLDLNKVVVNDMRISGQVIAYAIENLNQNNSVSFIREASDEGLMTGKYSADFIKSKYSREVTQNASVAYGYGETEKSTFQVLQVPGDTYRLGNLITLDKIVNVDSYYSDYKARVTASIRGQIYANSFTTTMTAKKISINSKLKGVEYIYDFKKSEPTSIFPLLQIVQADMGRDHYQVIARVSEDGNLYYLSLPYGYGEDTLKDFSFNTSVKF